MENTFKLFLSSKIIIEAWTKQCAIPTLMTLIDDIHTSVVYSPYVKDASTM